MSFYDTWLRPALYALPAETAHDVTLRLLHRFPIMARLFVPFGPASTKPRDVFGVRFPSPVGLAAGMDKNGVALCAWESLGFGFVEVGTITPEPQAGNPKPRMFRYPGQRALINRMGFNNDGAAVVAERFRRLRDSGRWPRIPVGINLGKQKTTPLEDAPADYARSFSLLQAYGDYFVINVSSPNTPGLRELQAVESLRPIILAIQSCAGGRDKPLLVKIAPDLAPDDVREIAALADSMSLSGLIATNTTIDHASIPDGSDEAGGLSGAPLSARSTATLRVASAATRLPLIGSGGVMSAADGTEKVSAGASLVQVYTGFVYHGPALLRDIAASIP